MNDLTNILSAISGAVVDLALIGGAILLIYAAILAHRSGFRVVRVSPPRGTMSERRGRNTITWQDNKGRRISKEQFYAQNKRDKSYWKEPVIWDKKSRQYISREEDYQRRNGGERITSKKPYKKPYPKKSFTRPVRNISSRYPYLKKRGS